MFVSNVQRVLSVPPDLFFLSLLFFCFCSCSNSLFFSFASVHIWLFVSIHLCCIRVHGNGHLGTKVHMLGNILCQPATHNPTLRLRPNRDTFWINITCKHATSRWAKMPVVNVFLLYFIYSVHDNNVLFLGPNVIAMVHPPIAWNSVHRNQTWTT